jgi:hypothetical protein
MASSVRAVIVMAAGPRTRVIAVVRVPITNVLVVSGVRPRTTLIPGLVLHLVLGLILHLVFGLVFHLVLVLHFVLGLVLHLVFGLMFHFIFGLVFHLVFDIAVSMGCRHGGLRLGAPMLASTVTALVVVVLRLVAGLGFRLGGRPVAKSQPVVDFNLDAVLDLQFGVVAGVLVVVVMVPAGQQGRGAGQAAPLQGLDGQAQPGTTRDSRVAGRAQGAEESKQRHETISSRGKGIEADETNNGPKPDLPR